MSEAVRSDDLAAADMLAAPKDRQMVGEGRHLAELVGDHQDRKLTRLGKGADMAQDLVSLARGEDGGRLVQDEETVAQVKLLEDFQLLLFTGGQVADGLVQCHA
jgi:hypothetical protein